MAEHVPHDDEVGVLALYAHAVHAEELREERAAVTLHYVLQESRETIKHMVYRLVIDIVLDFDMGKQPTLRWGNVISAAGPEVTTRSLYLIVLLFT